MLRLADLHESNHQLESRVREIRLPGSEGGALVTNVPTPILNSAVTERHALPAPLAGSAVAGAPLSRSRV